MIKYTHKNINIFIGQKLRKARVSCGISQDALAFQIGVTKKQLHAYEIGEVGISFGKLMKALRYFNITPTAFFNGIELYIPSNAITSLPQLKQAGYQHG